MGDTDTGAFGSGRRGAAAQPSGVRKICMGVASAAKPADDKPVSPQGQQIKHATLGSAPTGVEGEGPGTGRNPLRHGEKPLEAAHEKRTKTRCA